MKVLGIDTSLRSTGYGVLSAEGSRLRMVECGAIRILGLAVGFTGIL